MGSIETDDGGPGVLIVQMPPELKDQLRAAAEEERTMSAQIRLLVAEWLAARRPAVTGRPDGPQAAISLGAAPEPLPHWRMRPIGVPGRGRVLPCGAPPAPVFRL